MQTLSQLRRRTESAETLQSVVKTMKALAASHVNQFERALAALHDYNTSVEMGLQVVLPYAPADPTDDRAKGALGAVVFGSDQGMCGQFNERIAAFAVAETRGMSNGGPAPRVLAVGQRALHALEDLGLPAEQFVPVPTSAEGVTPAVQELLLHLEVWQRAHEVGRVILLYNAPAGAVGAQPHSRQLLPLDAQRLARLMAAEWPARGLPTFPSDPGALLSALIQEYIFVGLCMAYAESLAAENVARLASMQSAEKNIEEHLAELRAFYHQARQGAVTEELLDIASGFTALTRRTRAVASPRPS